jgi:hypothetical protein
LPSEATPHRRGAFRLVALVVFEVFANFVVNALIKDLPTPRDQSLESRVWCSSPLTNREQNQQRSAGYR